MDRVAASLSREHGIKATVEVSGEEQELSPETKLALFRIAQEALNNIKTHAEATEVSVELRYQPEKTTMIIADNGKGLELPQRFGDLASTGRLGLTGMEERATSLGGSLRIISHLREGSTVIAELPQDMG